MSSAAWEGPPRGVLGHPAVIRQFVARTDRAVVALQHALAFPEGCLLTLHVALRRGSLGEPAWERLRASLTGEGPYVPPADADLKFGVRFPGGPAATTTDSAFRGLRDPSDRPEPPVLIEAGGGSASDDWFCRSDRQLWLWPLPPPGPFEFVIQWPGAGIDATAATLDGSAIARAARHALPYWP
jgi:hypothetical protein